MLWIDICTPDSPHMHTWSFRYLAAKCLAEVEEWDECLTLLGDGELDDDLQDAVRQPGRASWLLSM